MFQIYQNTLKYIKICRNILEFIIIKIYRMYHYISEYIRIYQNKANFIRIYQVCQNILEYIRIYQNVSEYVRIYQNIFFTLLGLGSSPPLLFSSFQAIGTRITSYTGSLGRSCKWLAGCTSDFLCLEDLLDSGLLVYS